MSIPKPQVRGNQLVKGHEPDPARSLAGRGNAGAANAPEREIPAVISLLKDRLNNIDNMARSLRERLAPAMSSSNPEILSPGANPRISPLAQDIELAIAQANDITEVLTDILDRLEV